MTRRISTVGALLVAALAAGCDEQPAGPAREDSAENAGNAIVTVLTAKDSNITNPTYTPSTGTAANPRVTVNLYRLDAYAAGDTAPMRFATNDNNGRVVFSGLTAGQYIVKPVARVNSVFAGQMADTITIEAGQTDSSASFRFRPGARIQGQLSAFRNTPTGPATSRFGGVTVELLRETAIGSGTFNVVATTETDAAGNYFFEAFPNAQAYRIRFAVPAAAITDTAVAARQDSLRFSGTALSSQVTFNGPTSGANRGLLPDITTQNFQFTLSGRIAGTAFRDNNANGTQDAGENLVVGDTVNVVLLNQDKSRVIATSRVFVAANGTRTDYSFTSVQGGSYVVRVDPTTSRFPSTPALRPTGTLEFEVTVPNSGTTVTQNIPVVLREATP